MFSEDSPKKTTTAVDQAKKEQKKVGDRTKL